MKSPPACAVAQPAGHVESPVKAPFLKVKDSLCVNDWWDRPANPIIDFKVARLRSLCRHNGILKLSVQLYPLYPSETREVRLEVERDARWAELVRRSVIDLGWSTAFRIEKWDHSRDQKYRLRHGERATFVGLIRNSHVSKDEIKLAALSCDSNRDRGLRPEYTRNLNHQDPGLDNSGFALCRVAACGMPRGKRCGASAVATVQKLGAVGIIPSASDK